MKTFTLTTLLIALAILHVGYAVQYFEFGRDSPNDRVLVIVEGDIRILEKSKVIQLDIPHCYKVTYVKVSVDNWFSTPKVDFDFNINTVTISYNLLANDMSHYRIVAKGYRDPNCY